MEDLSYRRLLDAYYLSERPLNGSSTDVAREIGMRDHVDAVEYILGKYFEQTEEGWRNKRADAEIAHFVSKKQQASNAGKASAQRRLNGRSTDVGFSSADVQPTNNQEPITNLIEGKPSSRSAPCPYDEIVSLYMECLPTLPRVIVSNTKRRSLMKKRWSWILTSTKQDGTRRAEDKEQALDWLRSYFERVSTNPFLMGDNDRGWKADIDYLMEDRGLKSVIERMQ